MVLALSPFLRDSEVPDPTPMELEAQHLPEPHVQVASMEEPTVSPLEETVSRWRRQVGGNRGDSLGFTKPSGSLQHWGQTSPRDQAATSVKRWSL
jgi:hypothetical protein